MDSHDQIRRFVRNTLLSEVFCTYGKSAIETTASYPDGSPKWISYHSKEGFQINRLLTYKTLPINDVHLKFKVEGHSPRVDAFGEKLFKKEFGLLEEAVSYFNLIKKMHPFAQIVLSTSLSKDILIYQ